MARLYYPNARSTSCGRDLQMPDWVVLHHQLHGDGMTKQLLWLESTVQYPNR